MARKRKAETFVRGLSRYNDFFIFNPDLLGFTRILSGIGLVWACPDLLDRDLRVLIMADNPFEERRCQSGKQPSRVLEHFHQSYSDEVKSADSGLFGFWRRFGSVIPPRRDSFTESRRGGTKTKNPRCSSLHLFCQCSNVGMMFLFPFYAGGKTYGNVFRRKKLWIRNL
jgi:hypothetical protein